jgi:hypothetical protein
MPDKRHPEASAMISSHIRVPYAKKFSISDPIIESSLCPPAGGALRNLLPGRHLAVVPYLVWRMCRRRKTTISGDQIQVGIKLLKITKGVYSDGAGHGIAKRDCRL